MSILEQISANFRFKNGKEVKKKNAWYALRCRSPPLPPTVSLPGDKPLTHSTLRDWLARGGKVTYHPAW